ncbi:hypothetical protein Pme01_28840 [Planosporangium mesophilum]|uniref:Uncharacterized protein n=1 Tax=Planosporangium mesophilum TaxID=689768 RepID=A0A8J3X0G6_9ACTN|nr:hypothetical protein Pme01_28840 [Planosporangium mesophilum]
MLYGRLTLTNQNGFLMVWDFSRPDTSEAFAANLHRTTGPPAVHGRQGEPPVPTTDNTIVGRTHRGMPPQVATSPAGDHSEHAAQAEQPSPASPTAEHHPVAAALDHVVGGPVVPAVSRSTGRTVH